MSRPGSVPKYRLHKSTGQAIVTVRIGDERRDVYLGLHNSPASRQEYARIIAELATRTAPVVGVPVAPSVMTVDVVIYLFLDHARTYYRGPDGKPTDELREIKRSVLYLHKIYGASRAAEFGPRALENVRRAMIGAGWCRSLINRRIERTKRAFKWAVSQELIPSGVYEALRTLPGLKKGRTTAREAEPVGPVDPAHVAATLPLLSAHLRTASELQMLTGMRPGEACGLCAEHLDRTGDVWVYRPPHHKTAHRGKARTIYLGPKARAVLLVFLRRDGAPPDGFAHIAVNDPAQSDARRVMADAYQEAGRLRDAELLRDIARPVMVIDRCVVDPSVPLFSPQQARAEWVSAVRAKRKSKVPPSQLARKKVNPKKTPGAAYSVASYGYAVRKACQKAGVPGWHPNQLRHLFATTIRSSYGLEAAQVLLGHSRADVTQIYAERDEAAAIRIAAEQG